MGWLVYPWRVLVNLFYVAVVGYVFARLHERDEKIYVAILGLIYATIRSQGMITGLYLVPMLMQMSRQINLVGSLVDPSIQLPRDEADQVERLTMHLYFRAAIEALGVLAIAAYCLLVLFTALNESPF